MSLAIVANLVTTLLCAAVLFQCARMRRSLVAFRQADFPAIVRALDAANTEARRVLHELRDELRDHAGPASRTLEEARAIGEELGVMVGIANASADRLLDASRAGRREDA